MSKTKKLIGTIAALLAALGIGWFGYFLGAATQPRTPPAKAPGAGAAFSAQWKDWLYPLPKTEESIYSGAGSISTYEYKEPFPGARFLGRAESITYRADSGNMHFEMETTTDPIERVYTYYRNHAPEFARAGLQSTTFSTPDATQTGMYEGSNWTYTVKNTVALQTGDKRSAQLYANDKDSVAILLSQRKNDATTSIAIITRIGPTTTTTAVHNPPQWLFAPHR